MLSRLRELVRSRLSETESPSDEGSVALAAAMLLLEVAWADHEIEDDELAAIRTALGALYDADDQQIDAIIQQARCDHESSTGMFPFTRHLNEALDRNEKKALLEHLWRVTRFDGDRHHYEEHVIRRITELLYLNHSDFIDAKLRVKSDG